MSEYKINIASGSITGGIAIGDNAVATGQGGSVTVVNNVAQKERDKSQEITNAPKAESGILAFIKSTLANAAGNILAYFVNPH